MTEPAGNLTTDDTRPQENGSRKVMLLIPDNLPRYGALAPLSLKSFRVYRNRWLVLTLFAAVSMLNNVVCFTFASVTHYAEDFYHSQGFSLSWLITIFFLVFVFVAYPSSILLERYGLRKCVVAGAWLQAIGAILRIGSIWVDDSQAFVSLLLIGQVIAALAQGFFVNTPTVISELWFAHTERTLATTLACNANHVGIAVAFLAGVFVDKPEDIPLLLEMVAVPCLVVAMLVTLGALFPEKPVSPPSRSASMKDLQLLAASSQDRETAYSLRSMLFMFDHKGFVFTVVTFSMSESVINVFSSLLNYMLVPRGFSVRVVGVMGCIFVMTCMAGSGVFSAAVDRTKKHKTLMVAALTGLLCSIVYFNLLEDSSDVIWLINTGLSVALIGFFVGPVQPISMEIAIECTYPSPQALIVAIQQIVGNALSTALVPIMAALRDPSTNNMDHSQWLLAGVCGFTLIFFLFFNGEFLRMSLDADSPSPTSKAKLVKDRFSDRNDAS